MQAEIPNPEAPQPKPAETPPDKPKEADNKPDPIREALASATAAHTQGDNIALAAHLRRALLLLEPDSASIEEPRGEATKRRDNFSRYRRARTSDTFTKG